MAYQHPQDLAERMYKSQFINQPGYDCAEVSWVMGLPPVTSSRWDFPLETSHGAPLTMETLWTPQMFNPIPHPIRKTHPLNVKPWNPWVFLSVFLLVGGLNPSEKY